MILTGPGVLLTAEDCLTLGPQLAEAIRLAFLARGLTPPRALVEHADRVNRCSARFRAALQANTRAGTAEPAGVQEPESSVTRLTVTEAANIAQVSSSYMRRLLRRGDLTGTRSGRAGVWEIDAASLRTWVDNRTGQRQKVA